MMAMSYKLQPYNFAVEISCLSLTINIRQEAHCFLHEVASSFVDLLYLNIFFPTLLKKIVNL